MSVTKKKQPTSSQPASPVQPPRRLETGVPRLDYILKRLLALLDDVVGRP